MKHILSIDLETFSDNDITNGVYKYTDTDNFMILLCGYAFDDDEVTVIDMTSGEKLPDEFISALTNPDIEKHAFNASFERVCLSRYLYGRTDKYLSPEGWWCTQKHAAMYGLPSSLKDVGKVLNLDQQKDAAGKYLINYFSKPCKEGKRISLFGDEKRHTPESDPEKWALFKKYNAQDVRTERAISHWLDAHYPGDCFKEDYWINEKVNDRGVLIDTKLCTSIIDYNKKYEAQQMKRFEQLTGISSPKQVMQFKAWLSAHGVDCDGITKDTLPDLIAKAPTPEVKEALEIRQRLSLTSITKYQRMLDASCSDGRVHGVMNYYGASRTGRFAGRIIQTQNLPRNHMQELDEVRTLIKQHDWETLEMLYGDDLQDVFKQLIRTAIIAPEGYVLSVADYSAIEARVIAWLAHETETEKIFAPNGSQKIYESTAARMFNVPIETIAKGKPNYALRQRGKVATLALGYGGGIGAMRRMDVTHMLDDETDDQVQELVTKWRQSNPHIVAFWKNCENAAKQAIWSKGEVEMDPFTFRSNGHDLFVKLPSGRWLTYVHARVDSKTNQILYAGTETGGWCDNLKTYGGKLVENLVQATARDCLCGSLRALDKEGFMIIFHVHDEIICEVPDKNDANGKNIYLTRHEELMKQNLGTWDKGIYHPAPGYSSPYYLKD